MAKEFKFDGTDRAKFIKAGSNYVRKPINLENYILTQRLQWVYNNKEAVCSVCGERGWDWKRCDTCPVTAAQKEASKIISKMIEEAMVTSTTIIINTYNINNCGQVCVEPCAKDRGIPRPAKFNYINKNN